MAARKPELTKAAARWKSELSGNVPSWVELATEAHRFVKGKKA
jgi:hypothetical protein